jgi:hypothetical protein
LRSDTRLRAQPQGGRRSKTKKEQSLARLLFFSAFQAMPTRRN